MKEVEYDVMVSDADPDKNIDSAIMAAIEQLNDFGSRLELIVRSDNSDAVLKQMLKDDFKLRSMGAKEV